MALVERSVGPGVEVHRAMRDDRGTRGTST